jgi:hypothetical protein
MVKLSSTVETIVRLQRIKYFFLVTLGTDKFFTSLPYDITMGDSITYLSDSGLLGVDPPLITSTVDRSSYKVTFSDVNFLLKSYFEQGATGDNLSVRVGFFNTTEASIGEVAVGDPFTNLADTVLVYRGIIDSQKYQIDLSENEVYAVIEGSGPMADLDLVRPYFTNKDSALQRNGGDTSFDKVAEGSGQIKLKWGKV